MECVVVVVGLMETGKRQRQIMDCLIAECKLERFSLAAFGAPLQHFPPCPITLISTLPHPKGTRQFFF